MTVTNSQLVAPFSSRTRVALAIARALAAGYGHHQVTVAHALLGMLREGENPAVAVLLHAGISLPALRQELEQSLEPRGRPGALDVVLPLTDGEQYLTERADLERQRRDEPYLGTEHLLLAVLHDVTSPVSQWLARCGLTYDAAPTHLAAVIHHQPDSHDRHTG